MVYLFVYYKNTSSARRVLTRLLNWWSVTLSSPLIWNKRTGLFSLWPNYKMALPWRKWEVKIYANTIPWSLTCSSLIQCDVKLNYWQTVTWTTIRMITIEWLLKVGYTLNGRSTRKVKESVTFMTQVNRQRISKRVHIRNLLKYLQKINFLCLFRSDFIRHLLQ